jgi:glycosyltransferase involved in cell wall biosynthesis
MKIVHSVGWYFPESVGGTEVYVDALCRRLRAAGHQVTIAAPTLGPGRSYLHDGLPVFRYSIAAVPTRDEAWQRLPVRGAAALYRWLADERPDLLHVHSLTTGAGLPEIREARRLGIRVIATCHLPGLGFMCRTGELMEAGRVPCDGAVRASRCTACALVRLGLAGPLARAAAVLPDGAAATLGRLPGRIGTTLGMRASVGEYAQMQAELFELVDAFVVLNESARQMLIANGSPAAKIVVNRLGLAHPVPAHARERSATRPVRFGYIGRLHRAKGLIPLATAIRSIPVAVDFTVEIRGPAFDADSRDLLRELREIAAGDRRIVLAPAVAPNEVPAALSRLDVLLCPSVSFENGPTVALEAHAVGTPVIGSRVGGLTEIVQDGVNGRLVAPGASDEWAAAIADVALAPEETIERWRRHLARVRTMNEIAGDYLALYAA